MPMTAASRRDATVAHAAPATPIGSRPESAEHEPDVEDDVQDVRADDQGHGKQAVARGAHGAGDRQQHEHRDGAEAHDLQVRGRGRDDRAGRTESDADLFGVEVGRYAEDHAEHHRQEDALFGGEARLISLTEAVVARNQRDHRVDDPVEDDHRDRVDERRDGDRRDGDRGVSVPRDDEEVDEIEERGKEHGGHEGQPEQGDAPHERSAGDAAAARERLNH